MELRPPLIINGIDFNQRLDDARMFMDLSIDLIWSRDEYIRETFRMLRTTGMLFQRTITLSHIFDKQMIFI